MDAVNSLRKVVSAGLDKTLPLLRTAHFVPKLWGAEYWLENNSKYCLKLLHLTPGFMSSLHYHNKKDETFLVLDGFVELERVLRIDSLMGTDNKFSVKTLVPGDKVRLEPERAHRFRALNGDAFVLEVSTAHDDEDVVRLQESAKL